MDAKYLFWFTFLVVQASCEQKKSLTFVIDNSRSMTDDISYVRKAAKSIMDIVLNEKSTQIEDIVLVTFDDPTWEFRKRTRNERELKKALDDIKIEGNWDCPEMCLSGIKMGLEESLPGSYLYVFTDASAKDYKKFEEIKNLCQEKQIQIVFVLTGICRSISSKVYYEIAAASNGQVFRVSKTEIEKVLEYVRETIKGDRTVITSTVVHPKHSSDSYVFFNIDDKTEYALVSASGSQVTLKVTKDGTELPGIKVTWTANVKVLKLVGITPGLYRAAVRGTSDVNVIVFGRTDFNFEFGFSKKKQSSLKYTETQPTIGSETHLIISVKDAEHSVNIENVEILDMNEMVIRRLPLTNVGTNVYSTDKFLPPNVMFKVAVTATARSTRNPIRRIANTPVEPIKPVIVAPEITDTEKYIKAMENSKVNIHCRIRKGKPKPHVTWYFRQRGAKQFELLSGRTDEALIMNNVVGDDTGEYQCVAENIAGRATHVVQLEVFASPEFEATPAKITEKENAAVNLKCKLRKGNPRPRITWYFQASGSYTITTLRNNGEELRLPAVQLKDAGEYRCVAENSAGRDERTMLVTVLASPEFEATPAKITEKENAAVNLKCKLRKGNPRPRITWYFQASGSYTITTLRNNGEELRLPAVQLKDAGEYRCVAENSAGRDERTMLVTVLASPEFEATPAKITEKENAAVNLKCKLRKGNPRPRITWYFQASGSYTITTLRNNGEELRLPAVQLKDAGEYRCVAENSAGRDERTMLVTVLASPEFEATPAKITEKENAAVNLKCKLRKGNPRPRITWYFQASGSATFTTLRNNGEELRLPAVQLKDAGEYRCVAENSAGRDERTMLVTVLAAPEIERSTPVLVKVKENATISIPCRLSKGFPKPTVTWWYMDANSTEYAAIPDSNAEYLRLEHIQLPKAGHYKCVARNAVGQTDKDVQVIVQAPARIVFIPPNSRVYEGVEGDVVMRLPCTAVGIPKPSVSWIVDQVVVEKDKSRSLYVEDDVLYLKNPQRFNSSYYSKNTSHTYLCHATNDLGEDEQSYNVTVSEFADYEYDNTDEKYAEAKKPYDINCPLLYTDPNSVRWFYNSIHMNKTGPSLHFDDPTPANNGNYTCRVSDLNGAASYTVELKFDYPPSASRLVYEKEWDEKDDEITCKAEIRYGKYEWFYRGEKVKDAHESQLSLIGWGQYICRVTNPLGTLNITYNIYAKDCVIERNLSKTKNLPLLLDMSFTWPSFHRQNQYQIIPKSEKLTFICQDELPKNRSISQSGTNSFTKFPNTKSIVATCDHEDLFLVDGVSYKFSELDCKDEVSSSIVPIKECLGSDTMMMRVGFNVNGFLDVYKSCMDTKRNVVLYTEVITTGADSLEYTNEPERPCVRVTECCYESVQLVNAADVGAGPAEKATLRKTLNTVSYCKPNDNNTMSWHDIETQVRKQLSQLRLRVWSGAVNYTSVDKLLVPQYLWKVVKDLDSEDMLAIVHSNEQEPKASVCESVCDESSWFEPYGPRTYCCRLDEFKKMFGLNINF